MKPILKILVLGAVLILGTIAVVDQGLAADKGSQLIFQSNMAHKSFISIANAHDTRAVTLLTQYYNDEMEMVLWYLRIVLPNGNVLVDPFDHSIPGSDPAVNTGDFIMGTGKAGSGHFVIAVTAVATDAPANADATPVQAENTDNQANILFPTFLAEGMGADGNNIDEGGNVYAVDGSGIGTVDDTDAAVDGDQSSKNVGDLNVENAMPVGFNHLTGHFTEALISTDAGGSDQTASWGGTPVVRRAMAGDGSDLADDYDKLEGPSATAFATGDRLAEMNAGGTAADISNADAAGRAAFTAPSDIAEEEDTATNRGINMGALVLPALHGGGDETKQIMLVLSVADIYGGAGKYELKAAKTRLMVSLMDGMGGTLADPKAAAGPVFGGADDPMAPPGTHIIVDGIRVWTDAGDCNMDAKGNLNEEGMIMGPWTLDHLTSIVPSAIDGTADFAGLGAEMDPMMNASPGWIKFKRMALSCKRDYGDGDAATGSTIEDPDGVPTKNERTYATGTVLVEQEDSRRTYVTVGRALLKFITADSTFAASWTLKSPPN